MPYCYRHPNRETFVSCSECGRPICAECMTAAPVGQRCPEHSGQPQGVRRVSSGMRRGTFEGVGAICTKTLVAINVLIYLFTASQGGGLNAPGGKLFRNWELFGPAVANGDWWRLFTSAFLHASLIHIGFNMFALFFLGRILEPSIGTPRFVGVYFAALFGGAFGALLLDPNALTIGASGAIFGIFGATFVVARGRGFDAVASSIGVVLLINLALSFGAANISLGGHLGGLAAGVLCGAAIIAGDRGRLGENRLAVEMAVIVGVLLLAILGALAIA